jgi:replicative DNA helicase
MPIYIDDKPNAGVLEMRSLCRRLMAESGKELGLVVIDHLQLMEGSGSDNRVQELSRITRGLKQMAREIIVTKHRNGPVGTVKLLFEPLTPASATCRPENKR